MRPAAILFAAMVLASGQLMAQNNGARIVEEGGLGKSFDLAPGAVLAAPGYPQTYVNTGDDVCIALGYTVKPGGTTSDFRILNAWSSDRAAAEQQKRYLESFAGAAANAVSQWRFVPKNAEVSGAVQTVATIAFKGSGATEGLADRCRIASLAVHYGHRKADREFRQSMVAQGNYNDTLASMRGQAAAVMSRSERRGR